MLLAEIIGYCDLTQKIFSLHTFTVLPIKAKRTCSQQRKRKMEKTSRFLTEVKAYIVQAVRERRFLLAVPAMKNFFFPQWIFILSEVSLTSLIPLSLFQQYYSRNF